MDGIGKLTFYEFIIFEISWMCHPELVSGSHQFGPMGEMLNGASA
jgi:hypothetical protein